MIEELIWVKLPEGDFKAKALRFEESDRKALLKIYNDWRTLCDTLKEFYPKTRSINIPEILSQGIFCLEMNAILITDRIKGVKTSFNCYNVNAKERIQIKASSASKDMTSFGSNAEWDKLYFLDFFREGKWDGTFDIYLIENEDIYSHKVNVRETFLDQQFGGRRPRFSICKEIILKKGLKPIKSASLVP